MIRSSTLLLPLAAAASALALATTPASAAVTLTPFTAVTTGASPQVGFADVSSGLSVTCTSATAAGLINLGTLPAGGGTIATISSSTWTGCLGPLNLAMKVTQTAPWTVTGAGLTQRVNPVVVTGVAADVAAVQGGCSFKVTGTVNGTVNVSTGTIKLTLKPAGTLKLSSVVGCFGQVSSGDKASIKASYKVTPKPAA